MNAPTSGRRVLLAAAAALIVAVVLLFTAVLPAERGYDPLGTGEMLGLTALSREQPITRQPGEYRTDDAELVVRPGEWAEYSYRLDEGTSLLFSWQADGPLEVNFHSAPDDAPAGFAETYDSGTADSAHGSYAAPFTGTHGWYWENTGEREIVVRLHTAGFFDYSHEGRYRVSGFHSVTDLNGRELPKPER